MAIAENMLEYCTVGEQKEMVYDVNNPDHMQFINLEPDLMKDIVS